MRVTKLTAERALAGGDDVDLRREPAPDEHAGWSPGPTTRRSPTRATPTACSPASGRSRYERNGPDKSLSAITDGTGRTEETVDAVADLKTRRLTVGGAEKYRLELTTDATGRITGRREVDRGGRPHLRLHATTRWAS